MVEFSHAVRQGPGGLPAFATRCALALVQAHGLTDLRSLWRVGPYALVLWPPLPGAAVTGAFLVASLVHLAQDVGIAGTLLVHAIAFGVYAFHSKLLAFELMLGHLACVHVPRHYARVLEEARAAWAPARASVALALAVTLAGVWCAGAANFNQDSRDSCARVTHLHQRIVVAHVLSVHIPFQTLFKRARAMHALCMHAARHSATRF